MSMPEKNDERPWEGPGEYTAPEDVHEVEPEGDGADAPDADLSGESIPEDLSQLKDGDAS